MPRWLLFVCFFAPTLTLADPKMLLQLVDYVGVDYAEAVAGGEVINREEYREMQDFSARILEQVQELAAAEGENPLLPLAEQLPRAIGARQPAAVIAGYTRQLRQLIMSSYDLDLLPLAVPDLQQAAALYQAQCAACHGVQGKGNGPAAGGLEPAPTNFQDPVRARERSLYGLYNTMSLGVEGTAMASYAHLPAADRWALAFYVGGLYGAPPGLPPENMPLSLAQAVTLSPAELLEETGQGEHGVLWARHNPESLFKRTAAPLEIARAGIRDSVAAYEQGNLKQARHHAITAYLEGFELVEASLNNLAPDLVKRIERGMINYRSLLDGETPVESVAGEAAFLYELLDEADNALAGESLSPRVAFISSLVILLREGLEAILVIAAMAAYLIKTGNRQNMFWLHAGWLGALAAGVGTWAVSLYLIDISGLARELTEGVTALVAAGMLFYVGFWMHARSNMMHWKRYIQDKIQLALSRQTLWGVALLSFLAVYREIFEVMLFYQALWGQVAANAQASVWGGAVLALALLLVVTWSIRRFGLRLPLGKFFTLASYMMIALAVILAGKGVAALQEAGAISVSRVNIPAVEILGIYPNLQGLIIQTVILGLAVVLIMRQRRKALAN